MEVISFFYNIYKQRITAIYDKVVDTEVILVDIQKLKTRMKDYQRYAMILMTVSVFLYIGVAFQHAGKEPFQIYLMMGTTSLFLALAIFFVFQTRKLKKLINEQQED
ncbi:YrhC family protein [Sutcliffiella cohnii]|uniref:YrhC family protein n=1 Tax=Sutcliffiella cohnii TaxID=33932 RepID=UPI002E25001E|nr:YrhC family protein [Sutcliffiella cohnii]